MMSSFVSTDTVSKSTAPWSFAMHGTNEEKVSPKTCNLVIEYENSTVDLSNLVYSRRSLLSSKVTTKNSGLKKPTKILRGLYPSKSKVNVLQDSNNASYIFAKSRMEQQFRPKKQLLPRQASIIRRRSKMDQESSKIYFASSNRSLGRGISNRSLGRGLSNRSLGRGISNRSLGRGISFKRRTLSSYSRDEAQDHELLSPGTYDGTPSDTYECPPAYDDYTPPFTHAEMEISPGVFVPLRGSQETLDAMREGDCVNVHCFCCAAKLLCISDAEYVVCPDCRVVSPVDLPGKRDVGGVGLGLRAD
jgi:hypothetical protein